MEVEREDLFLVLRSGEATCQDGSVERRGEEERERWGVYICFRDALEITLGLFQHHLFLIFSEITGNNQAATGRMS